MPKPTFRRFATALILGLALIIPTSMAQAAEPSPGTDCAAVTSAVQATYGSSPSNIALFGIGQRGLDYAACNGVDLPTPQDTFCTVLLRSVSSAGLGTAPEQLATYPLLGESVAKCLGLTPPMPSLNCAFIGEAILALLGPNPTPEQLLQQGGLGVDYAACFGISLTPPAPTTSTPRSDINCLIVLAALGANPSLTTLLSNGALGTDYVTCWGVNLSGFVPTPTPPTGDTPPDVMIEARSGTVLTVVSRSGSALIRGKSRVTPGTRLTVQTRIPHPSNTNRVLTMKKQHVVVGADGKYVLPAHGSMPAGGLMRVMSGDRVLATVALYPNRGLQSRSS